MGRRIFQTAVLILTVSTICLAITWREGLNFYSSVSVPHDGKASEIYKARNTALALAQYELLEELWNFKLNKTTTLRTWASKNGYTKYLEGMLKRFEVVEEKIGPVLVEITLKKELDVEELYKAIGKNFEPSLQREFTGVVIIIPRNVETYLMPEIRNESGETIFQVQMPLVIYEGILDVYESPIVGYVPILITALAVVEDKIIISVSKLIHSGKWGTILELMKNGKIVLLSEEKPKSEVGK